MKIDIKNKVKTKVHKPKSKFNQKIIEYVILLGILISTGMYLSQFQ